jgi:uncharacterized protein (DUF2236 family)/Ca2+-binding EF-hand superfamily protein
MTSSSLTGRDSLLRSNLGEWRIALVAWRLLVLQTADPVVAAGMSQYSTYRAHPWRRVEHTMDSGRRLFFSDGDGLRHEIGRLERTHRRIRGTDKQGSPFTAEDPEVRAWVLVTLYESITAMRELSGDPFTPAELDLLYAEFRTVCAEFELPDAVFPPTAADVPAYMERTIRERLECGEEVRYLLYEMLREAPRPRRLRRLGPAWPLVRVLIARTMLALTVADLPPAFGERFGLPRTRSAALLSWTLHHGMRQVMTRLPDRVRYRSSPTGTAPTPPLTDDSAAQSPGRAPRPRSSSRPESRRARLDAFFRQVLDQTGDGRINASDLQAMAHNVCWRLELPAEREAQVYAAFDTWWQQIRTSMDTDNDGHVTRAEFVRAVLAGVDRDPDYLDKGLHVALRAFFHAADTDGSGFLCADEYRVIFGGSRVHPAELNHGFRQLDADGDGRITLEEFVRAFTDFFTARTDTSAGSHLLGRP